MDISNLTYRTKTATEEEVYAHLNICNDNFYPPLSEKVNIENYSKRIFEKSVTFEAWVNNILVGLIAVYFNDLENHSGYITNVSITKEFKGEGIASELLNRCIQYAERYNFNEISLKVSKDNSQAINLYKKFSFFDFKNKDDFVVMKLEINKS